MHIQLALKAYSIEAPLVVGFPGPLAGAAALALERRAGRLTLEVLSHEGISVDVRGAESTVARVIANTVRFLLEGIGEEARIRVLVDARGAEKILAPSLAGVAVRAVSSMLGIEPAISDIALTLSRALATSLGKPMLPHAAAAYLDLPAIGVEQPPLIAALPGPIDARVHVIEPCWNIKEPVIAVEASKHAQLIQAASILPVLLAEQGWTKHTMKLSQMESPWDYAAPEPYKRARRIIVDEGGVAGIDPYTGVFVALIRPGMEEFIEKAKAILSTYYNCRPNYYSSMPRKPRWGEY